jgi:hypothetical protein
VVEKPARGVVEKPARGVVEKPAQGVVEVETGARSRSSPRYARPDETERMNAMKKELKTKNALPDGIVLHDLKYPSYKLNVKNDPNYFDYKAPYEDHSFELWFVPSLGWCIPTLGIRNPGRRSRPGAAPRTYAVKVSDGGVVRIGLGPHVAERVTVYVRKNRAEALAKFIALKNKGAVDANNIRDRISTRRAQGALYRMEKGW